MLLWLFVYLVPCTLLVVLLFTKSTYPIQKKKQTWLYFIEIYYVSLFFTMLTTKIISGYFFLWNGNDSFDSLISRFFTSYAIYQIWVLVKRNLDNPADIDSYNATKMLVSILISCIEENDITKANLLFNNIVTNPDSSFNKTMLNEECKDLINALKQQPISENMLLDLKIEIIKIDCTIGELSLSWNNSFLLFLFK